MFEQEVIGNERQRPKLINIFNCASNHSTCQLPIRPINQGYFAFAVSLCYAVCMIFFRQNLSKRIVCNVLLSVNTLVCSRSRQRRQIYRSATDAVVDEIVACSVNLQMLLEKTNTITRAALEFGCFDFSGLYLCFYRAMHAVPARYCYRKSSVRLCLSATYINVTGGQTLSVSVCDVDVSWA